MRTLFLFITALVVLIAMGGVTTHASSADGQIKKIKKTTGVSETSNSVNRFTVIEDDKGDQNLMKTIGVFKVSGDGVWFELGAPISDKDYKTMIPENNSLFDLE
jgi:hypothetical protein